MRLIDADALKIAVQVGEGHNWNSYDDDERCVRKKYIDNAPTVKGEILTEEAYSDLCLRASKERPQGKWIKKTDDVGFISHICSECGAEIEVENPCDNKFCFNCGAKMEEYDSIMENGDEE